MAKNCLALWIAFFACACGARAAETAAASPRAPAPPRDAVAPQAQSYERLEQTVMTDSANLAAAPAPMPAGTPGQPAPPSQPVQAASRGAQPQMAREMLDIQASLQIKVANLEQSVKAIHALARKHKGTVTEERLQAQGRGSSEASLTLRVPSGASDVFFDDLRRVGHVLSQQISARDIGKEFHDAGILLNNLEATMRRYEEILQKAQNVQEILHIEGELARIRGEIDRVKGNLRWLSDRAARATVNVTLRTDQPQPEIIVAEPKARFYPGVRGSYVADYRGDDGGGGYLGGGLSLRFSRAVSLEVDGLRGLDSDTRGLDLFLATIGGEVYSEFLGDGKRRFLNPYLGLRGGYARFLGKNEGVGGVTLGVELFKSEFLLIDADLRLLGFFFGEPGAHAALQPTLGANFAF